MEFLNEILEDAKTLVEPLMALLKGMGNIVAKVFVFLADLIKDIISKV